MLDNKALGAASFTLLATFRVANQVSVFIDVEHHHLHICQKLPLYMPMGCCQGLQIFTEFDAGWSAIAVAAAVIDEIAGVVLDEVVHHSCQIVALAASDAAGGGGVGGGHTHPAAVVEQQLFGGLRTKISATSSS